MRKALPNQLPLFPPDPAAEVIASLRTWPDADLFRLARAIAAELGRRQLPTPAALPIVEAMEGIRDWGLGIGTPPAVG